MIHLSTTTTFLAQPPIVAFACSAIFGATTSVQFPCNGAMTMPSFIRSASRKCAVPQLKHMNNMQSKNIMIAQPITSTNHDVSRSALSDRVSDCLRCHILSQCHLDPCDVQHVCVSVEGNSTGGNSSCEGCGNTVKQLVVMADISSPVMPVSKSAFSHQAADTFGYDGSRLSRRYE